MKCETAVCPYANAFDTIATNFDAIARNFDELNTVVINLAKRSLSANEYEAFCKEIEETHNKVTEKKSNKKNKYDAQ